MKYNLNPPQEEINKWGALACVSKKERDRILRLPFGYTKEAIKQVEKDIKKLKSEDKKRQQDTALKTARVGVNVG